MMVRRKVLAPHTTLGVGLTEGKCSLMLCGAKVKGDG